MILLTFKTEAGLRLGVKTPIGVVDVKAALAEFNPSLDTAVSESLTTLLAGGPTAYKALEVFVNQAIRSNATTPWLLDENRLELGPCVPSPGKIICIGLNYRRHAAESGLKVPENPVLFSKFTTALAASGERIPLPSNAVQYDYEAELAVVIGRRARHVSQSEALNYVFGYCNANDLSARDLQFRTNQWLLGKTLDKFMPIGPYLVTRDEVGDPQALGIRCWVNGALRQNSSTADMIFSIAESVSYISQYMTLEPGDLISTGTPEGVVFGMTDKVWLRPGDEVIVEIDKLGRLTNVMRGDC